MSYQPLPNRLRVAVLMGGPSREREVSLVSGSAVCEALATLGHEVVPFEVTEGDITPLRDLHPDVAFVALHGTFGEDGGAQRACEEIGLPYTGSGPRASARAFDKGLTRRILVSAGLKVPDGVVLQAPVDAAWITGAMDQLGPRVVCKPACEGSSIGVHIVEGRRGLLEAVEDLNRLGGAILIERFIDGRELTVAVLGDRPLPPVEMIPERGFYDYTAKYDPSAGTRYHVDPPLATSVHEEVAEAALQAHRALECESFSRVDIRLTSAGLPVVLEVNTIPGLTPTSLLPKAAAAAGIGFGELCERMIADALVRAGKLELPAVQSAYPEHTPAPRKVIRARPRTRVRPPERTT